MKQKLIMAALPALMLAMLVACQSPTSDSAGGSPASTATRELGKVTYQSKEKSGDGYNIYKLTISENPNRAKFAVRPEDRYTLSVTYKDGPSKTSSGKIVTIGGGIYNLAADRDTKGLRLYVEITSEGLKKIVGTLTFDTVAEGVAENLDLELEPPLRLPPGSHPGVDSLSVGGDVWDLGMEGALTLLAGYPATYTKITDTNTVDIDDGGLGGIGVITNGYLSYQIGIPAYLSQLDTTLASGMDSAASFSGNNDIGWDNMTINPSTAKGAILDLVTVETDPHSVGRMELKGTISNGKIEAVQYIYVDQAATFKGNGKTSNGNSTKTFTVQLQKGWNPLLLEGKISAPRTGGSLEDIDITVKDLKFTRKDPTDIRWTMGSSD